MPRPLEIGDQPPAPRSVRDVLVDGDLLVRSGKLVGDDETVLTRTHRHLGRAGRRRVKTPVGRPWCNP